MPRRRIVVARLGLPGQPREVAPPVGIVRVISGKPFFAVVVKLTLDIPREGEPAVARPAREQEPISLARPSQLPGADEQELQYPSDFVPIKPRLDVLLYGNAYRSEEQKQTPGFTRIDARWSVGSTSRQFAAVAMGEARWIPLSRAYLRSPDDLLETGPVGPLRRSKLVEPVVVHGRDFNPNLYSSAAPEQRLPKRLEPDAPIELEGLSPDAPRVAVRLPGLSPKVLVDMRDRRFGKVPPVAMACDTLWLAPDQRRAVMVFRGIFEVLDLDEPRIEQLVVAFEQQGKALLEEEIRRDLPRAAFFHATEREHVVAPAPAAPRDKAALEAARYRALQHAVPPDPELSLERYVAIAAELCQRRQKRADVLARHGLDEYAFSLEQRGWAHRIAEARAAGDRTVGTRHARLFVEAKARLAAEPRRLPAAETAGVEG
jgi:hypothetical protein